MKKALTFSDVLIVPKYSTIRSRSEVDLTTKLGKHISIKLPVIAANMKSVCGLAMVQAMHSEGGIGFLHRFKTIEEAIVDAQVLKEEGIPFGVSIGVQEEDKHRFVELYEYGARVFVIDVAHGDHILVKEMLHWIQSSHPTLYKEADFIAGNIATGDAALRLIEWGATCVKVGIGPGRACTTRKNTGIGMPQLTALEMVNGAIESHNADCSVISDGGITCIGDIAKALGYYADAVMVGSFISGTTETPGKVFKDETGSYYKVYSGSASGENKHDNGQPTDFVEGISIKVPFRGHVKYVLREIRDGLRSAFSYVGASNLEEFRANCEFIELSGGGKAESKL